MLVTSCRTSARDADLWIDLSTADESYAQIHRERLERLSYESLRAIEDFTSEGPCYASVSWGKDSVVLAHLVRLWGERVGRPVSLVNLRIHPTRNPDCDAVRDAFLDQFPGPYHEEPVDYAAVDPSLPSIEWDRLTYKLWDAAWANVDAMFGGRHMSGVRSQESFARRMRMTMHGWATKRTCAPIGYWRLTDVFAWLATHDLPVHPAYAMLGGGRWRREQIRVAEIGDEKGAERGRRAWEMEYYGDVLRRLEAGR